MENLSRCRPAAQRANMRKALDARCQKMRYRLDTFCHQAAAMLVAFAVRQGVGELIYDETPTGYLESFPWFSFKEKLSNKLDAAGITLKAAALEKVS